MHLPPLTKGDRVDIIAPASRTSSLHVESIQTLLQSWGLACNVDNNMFGDDLLCANTDAMRFQLLSEALINPAVKAIICARGGYGSARLLSSLEKIKAPKVPKFFVGMSDATALHLFLQRKWQWPTLHGALSQDKFSLASILLVKKMLFAESAQYLLSGVPLNETAKKEHTIAAPLTGGNLSMIQTSIGTVWEMQARDNIIFLEEVNERGYRIDRMLEHLQQAQMFKGVRAIIFCDFLKCNEPDGSSLVLPVLARFAKRCEVPVVSIPGVGHDYMNHPLPLGVKVNLQLGEQVHLQW